MTETTTATAQRELGDPFEALSHFFMLATEHDHSGAGAAARLLLGLYNGKRFPFDLQDLRRFDDKNLRRAFALLKLDSRPEREVHEWLNRLYGRTDFGARFEHLAHRWRLKGKCKKEWLADIEPLRFGADSQ